MKKTSQANIVAFLHLVWIMLIFIGLPLGFFFSFVKTITITLVLITLLSWIIFKGCILGMIERRLRPAMNNDSFLQFYVKKYLGVCISRIAVLAAVISYLLITLVLFSL